MSPLNPDHGQLSLALEKDTKPQALFEVTSDSEKSWEETLNHVESLPKAMASESVVIEVVGHSSGIEKGLRDSGVVFAACENTMKKRSLSKDDLLPFVVTVDSGVAEVVRRQQQGWSYVREI